jgi:hypothetical protein
MGTVGADPSVHSCVAPQTLMDVLAGRKTGGAITGDILVNGFPKEPGTFARISGCEEGQQRASANTCLPTRWQGCPAPWWVVVCLPQPDW